MDLLSNPDVVWSLDMTEGDMDTLPFHAMGCMEPQAHAFGKISQLVEGSLSSPCICTDEGDYIKMHRRLACTPGCVRTNVRTLCTSGGFLSNQLTSASSVTDLQMQP